MSTPDGTARPRHRARGGHPAVARGEKAARTQSWIVKVGTTVIFLATVLGFVMNDAPLWELVVITTAWLVLAIAWLGEYLGRRRHARAGVANAVAPRG